jgi:hypothetical protein
MMMLPRSTAVFALVASTACSPYHGHYMSGTYVGSGSYSATLAGAGTGLAGAVPLDVAIDDSVGTNTYNEPVDGNVTLNLSARCVLIANYSSLVASRGTVTSVSAGVEQHQPCTLPVDGGEAVFVVSSGEATTVGSTLDLTLGGDLSSWDGMPANGYVTFTFHGAS